MDKLFWKTIQENQYAIPAGHTPTSLTAELFLYLGSTDPELRDQIAYETFANFLQRDYFSLDEIEIYIANLLANLDIGIGETDSDSVFLRSFSVLFLAEIIHNDNKTPLLKGPVIQTILEKGLWYLASEKDLRGYVEGKGWAHALAHTADLLLVLGRNLHTGESDHSLLLLGMSEKLLQSTTWVFVYGEDDRLSRAALEVLRRGTLSVTFVRRWMDSFLKPDDGSWKGAWKKERTTLSFFNVRNFVRSLYLQISNEEGFSQQEELEQILLETVQVLQPY
jgi:Protein of unknown function (DUF2785)